MNAHDLDAVAGFIHEDYRSEQPAHPGRAFVGRAQMLVNTRATQVRVQEASNTRITRTKRHSPAHFGTVLKSVCQPDYQARCA